MGRAGGSPAAARALCLHTQAPSPSWASGGAIHNPSPMQDPQPQPNGGIICSFLDKPRLLLRKGCLQVTGRQEEAPADPWGLTQGAHSLPAPLRGPPQHCSSCRDAAGCRVRIQPRRLQHLTGLCARAPKPHSVFSMEAALSASGSPAHPMNGTDLGSWEEQHQGLPRLSDEPARFSNMGNGFGFPLGLLPSPHCCAAAGSENTIKIVSCYLSIINDQNKFTALCLITLPDFHLNICKEMGPRSMSLSDECKCCICRETAQGNLAQLLMGKCFSPAAGPSCSTGRKRSLGQMK